MKCLNSVKILSTGALLLIACAACSSKKAIAEQEYVNNTVNAETKERPFNSVSDGVVTDPKKLERVLLKE